MFGYVSPSWEEWNRLLACAAIVSPHRNPGACPITQRVLPVGRVLPPDWMKERYTRKLLFFTAEGLGAACDRLGALGHFIEIFNTFNSINIASRIL